jgi:hypothetical protein
MRYALLAALVLSDIALATIPPHDVIPNPELPLTELAPCGADRATMRVLLPDGTWIDAMRVQWIYHPESLQIVGYEPRLFCSGME